jgi:hypothetical protein
VLARDKYFSFFVEIVIDLKKKVYHMDTGLVEKERERKKKRKKDRSKR